MYNFDEIIDRKHTNALNTDGFRGYIFHASPDQEEFARRGRRTRIVLPTDQIHSTMKKTKRRT